MQDQQQRIMGYFIEEARDHLNTLEQGLLNLQATVNDPEMINEVFRAAHSVKGGAAMLGLGSIQQTAHRLEDHFKVLKEHPIPIDRDLESLFLKVFDTLVELLDHLQGSFGLTDEIGDRILKEAEPAFNALSMRLSQEMQAQGLSEEETPTVLSPFVTGDTPESRLAKVFQQEVSQYLRQILDRFKQEDNAAGRSALGELCQQLQDLAQGYEMPEWNQLLSAAKQAVLNPDNSYRQLAPVLIRDIKTAQDLVIAGQGDAIAVGLELRELAQGDEGDTTEILPFGTAAVDLDAAGSPGSSSFEDLFDGDETEDALDTSGEAAIENAAAENSELDFDWLSGSATGAATGIDGIELNTGNPPSAPAESGSGRVTNGPEVGDVELNTLADLFEGEVSELEDVWTADDIESFNELNTEAETGSSSKFSDFSDLFFDTDAEGSTASTPSLEDDAGFLNDDFLDELVIQQGVSELSDMGDVMLQSFDGGEATPPVKPSAAESGSDASVDDLLAIGDVDDNGEANEGDLGALFDSVELSPEDGETAEDVSDEGTISGGDDLNLDLDGLSVDSAEAEPAEVADGAAALQGNPLDDMADLFGGESSGDELAELVGSDGNDDLGGDLFGEGADDGGLDAELEGLSGIAEDDGLAEDPLGLGELGLNDAGADVPGEAGGDSAGADEPIGEEELTSLGLEEELDDLLVGEDADLGDDTSMADLEGWLDTSGIQDSSEGLEGIPSLDGLDGEAWGIGDDGGELLSEDPLEALTAEGALDAAAGETAPEGGEASEGLAALGMEDLDELDQWLTEDDGGGGEAIADDLGEMEDLDALLAEDVSLEDLEAAEPESATPSEELAEIAVPELDDPNVAQDINGASLRQREVSPAADDALADLFGDDFPDGDEDPWQGDSSADTAGQGNASVDVVLLGGEDSDDLDGDLEGLLGEAGEIAEGVASDATAGGSELEGLEGLEGLGGEIVSGVDDWSEFIGEETGEIGGDESGGLSLDGLDLEGLEGLDGAGDMEIAGGLDELLENLGGAEQTTSVPSGDLDELDALASGLGLGEGATDTGSFSDLEQFLDGGDGASDGASGQGLFSELDGLLGGSDPTGSSGGGGAASFDDLEELLQGEPSTVQSDGVTSSPKGLPPEAATKADGVIAPAASGSVRNAKKWRFEETIKVPVKTLDTLNNLVGEMVVSRNSLEQSQERLRQSLENLMLRVQQLGDVGQRMQDLYERSLLELSLLASRNSGSMGAHHANSVAAYGSNIDDTAGALVNPGEDHRMGLGELELDRFTPFHTQSQEIIELIVRVRESASDIDFVVEEADQLVRNLRQVSTQIQEGLTKSRMVPFAQTADRLYRAVRNVSDKCGKQVELVVDGKNTMIDKLIAEQLYDPITHLVNNAITHGIETPEEREQAKKSATGELTIKALYQGNQTIISVSDDGAGIDVSRVRQKAIDKGLISTNKAKKLTDQEVYELLFQPGFTTKEQADDFAGRGVGMDVVRRNIQELRGNIVTDSKVGRGTSFTLRLPLNLSICKALQCLNDHAAIAFPMDGVEDMFTTTQDKVQVNSQEIRCIPWRDRLLPIYPLSDLLKYNRPFTRSSLYGGTQEENALAMVILRSAGEVVAIEVDQVLGEQEIVIKQPEGPIPKPIGIAGMTVLGDGQVMPIADVLELIDLSAGRVRRDPNGTWGDDDQPILVEPVKEKTEPMVLIVDDSITVRELLKMTFLKSGYQVEQARDGQEAWEKLRSGLPCDLVFCDIEMPRMDGLEFLSRLQKEESLSHLPVAMLTSRGADKHRQMATQLGARGYFTKPYLEEALLDAAQRMLQGEVLVTANA
ncbi:MAG: response regulator [Cyanophyceae cyanobacterium]